MYVCKVCGFISPTIILFRQGLWLFPGLLENGPSSTPPVWTLSKYCILFSNRIWNCLDDFASENRVCTSKDIAETSKIENNVFKMGRTQSIRRNAFTWRERQIWLFYSSTRARLYANPNFRSSKSLPVHFLINCCKHYHSTARSGTLPPSHWCMLQPR